MVVQRPRNGYGDRIVDTRVLLVDDHRLFREALRRLLDTTPDIHVVAEADSLTAALTLVRRMDPDVVVLDLLMPGIEGPTVVRELLRQNPDRKVLVLSMLKDARSVAEALDAGAIGFASKEQSVEEVVDAIRLVARGEQCIPPDISRAVLDELRWRPAAAGGGESPLAKLTNRERVIFDLTIRAMTSSAIARELLISRRTVETHRARIMRKFGAHSVVELVRAAARLGVLHP